MTLWADRELLCYRETVTTRGSGEAKVAKVVRTAPVYAHVRLSVEPLAREEGLEIVDRATARSAIPPKFLSSIEVGLVEAARQGLWGFPLVDARITIVDGSYHETDSTAAGFRLRPAFVLPEKRAGRNGRATAAALHTREASCDAHGSRCHESPRSIE